MIFSLKKNSEHVLGKISTLFSYSPKGEYLPVVYIDLLGCRLEDLVLVNQSVKELPVTFNYSPISFGKLRLWMQFSAAMHTLRQMGFTDKDIDELKGIFADTNIVLLCMTFVVAALHVNNLKSTSYEIF